MGLFRVEDGELIIAKDELRDIEEFAKIIRRDRSSKGDANGRKKYRAYKELMYVWHHGDYEAPFAKLEEKEKEIKILNACRLEPDYKPDGFVKEAIARYIEIYYDMYPSYRILNSLEQGINLSDVIVKVLIKSMHAQLEIISKAPEGSIIQVEGVINNFNTLMKISSTIPEALESIEKVREKVKVEQGGGDMIVRGNRAKGNREDPAYVKKFIETDADTDGDEN